MNQIHEVRVSPIEGDPTANRAISQAQSMMGLDISGLQSSTVYYVEAELTGLELLTMAERLGDPITDSTTVNLGQRAVDNRANPHIAEVAYNPAMRIAKEGSLQTALGLLGISDVRNVAVATEYRFPYGVEEGSVRQVVDGILVNPTVQLRRTEAPTSLEIVGKIPQTEHYDIAEMTDDELIKVSNERTMSLNLEELRLIRDYYKEKGRVATDAELDTFANTWSEHCVHKTFNAKIMKDGVEKDPFFKRIKDRSEKWFEKAGVTTAYVDNAGGIKFDEKYTVTIKLETHNSPSKVEPYGGAATGSGGVFRDIFGVGLGGKAILSMDMFGLAPPTRYFDLASGALEYANPHVNLDDLVDYVAEYPNDPGSLNKIAKQMGGLYLPDSLDLPEDIHHPEHIMREVIRGVGDYGNRMGIPTANGSFHFHKNFVAKPTVMVGSVGIQPTDTIEKGVPKTDDLVVSFGGLTGRDGIRGATFSSGKSDSNTSKRHGSAVQIGDPITEKLVQDLILEARDAGCFRAITDCGAAGFCSAVGEIGGDTGVDVDLKNAGLKFEGLDPWEIWISESQERMVAAMIPEKLDVFAVLAEKHGVHFDVLGKFTDDKNLKVRYGDEVVVDIDYDFLNAGLPQRVLEADWQAPEIELDRPKTPQSEAEWANRFISVMGHDDISSKQAIVERYDTEVQGGTVVKPYGGIKRDAPNDGVVIQPFPDNPRGVVVGHGMNPKLSLYDPYEAGRWATAEAVANIVASGGDPDKMAYCGNYVAGIATDPQVVGAVDLLVDGITETADQFEMPAISGKDSMNNAHEVDETGEIINVPEVGTVTIESIVEDVAQTVTTEIKKPGESILVLVGKQDLENMAGSAYYEVANGSDPNVPKVEQSNLETARAVHKAIKSGKILACHDVSEGGVAVAVTEMCFGGDCGADISMLGPEEHADNSLFNETTGVYVLEVDFVDDQMFQGVEHQVIGVTVKDKTFSYNYNHEAKFEISTDVLKEANQRGMQFLNGVEHVEA